MKTRKGYMSIFSRLGERFLEDDETMNDLNALQSDMDEKQEVLDNVGVKYDMEQEDYEYAPRDVNTDATDSWKTKYEDLRRKYVERFFNGDSVREEGYPNEVHYNEEKESINDITIDDIIKKESDNND